MNVIKWIVNGLKNLALGGVGIAGALFVALIAFQEKLIYVPVVPGMQREYAFDPSKLFLPFEDVWLETEDSVNIHCWFIKPFGKDRPTILWLQENAGNMSYRLLFVKGLVNFLKCNVFMVMYRGYGSSEGTPSEGGLKLDVRAALNHLTQRTDIDTASIVVFGRSLGGAVAIDLTSEEQSKIKALVVENTFTCIPDMGLKMFPFLGAGLGRNGFLSFLIRNKWDSIGKIHKIKVPILMLASGQDEMVPFEHMVKLHQAQKSTSCMWKEFPQAHHMTAYEEYRHEYWPTLKTFFESHVH